MGGSERHLRGGESGQALILFTIMTAVFLGFCLLVVDVGRAHSERRYMQNAADAGALAATGLVTGSLMPCTNAATGNVCSGITMSSVVQEAQAAVNANASLLGGYTAPIGVVVRYKRYDSANRRCSTSAWTDGDIMPSSSSMVPGDTCKVRVEVTSRWTTWFPLPTGTGLARQAGAASASATAMIVGDSSGEPQGDVWPMVRRRSSVEPFRDPTSVDDYLEIWNPQACQKKMDDCGSEWKAQVSLALNSNRAPYSTSSVPRNQPLEGSRLHLAGLNDAWRPGDSPWFGRVLTNHAAGGHGGATWNTKGNNPSVGSNFAVEDKFVDLGNWFAYAYRGKISLTRDWSAAPDNVCGNNLTGTKINCQVPTAAQLTSGAYNLIINGSWWRTTGDWVETYQGNLGNNMEEEIDYYIGQNGTMDPKRCPFAPTLGKCVVMVVFFWEGGQVYDSKEADPLKQWKPWKKTSESPDRVHLVDWKYFAFYQGLDHNSSSVEGFFASKAEYGYPTDYTQRPGYLINYYFMVGE